ncbi:hypothetical protein DQ04_23021000, partial [Trypanosoma grayi]|uniref:hypothetical protein n=1 Tax=Trypanosoma grayi TaxID=71804 RepID=UPI0004F4126B
GAVDVTLWNTIREAVEPMHTSVEALKKKLLPPKQSDVGEQIPSVADNMKEEAKKLVKSVQDNASLATSSLKALVDKTIAAVRSADAPVQQARAAAEKASEALENAAAGATAVLDAVRKINDIAAKGITAAVQSQTAVRNIAALMSRLSVSIGTVWSLQDAWTVEKEVSGEESAAATTQKRLTLTGAANKTLSDFEAVLLESISVTDAADAALAVAAAVVTEVTAAAKDAAAAVEAATAARAAAQNALTQAEGALRQLKEKLYGGDKEGEKVVATTPQGEHEDAPAVDGSHESHTSPPDATDPA